MGDFAALPVPPWDRLSVCCGPDRDHVNVAVDPAEESRAGPATGVWWHARRIASTVFVDLTDWTGGVRQLAHYILTTDGSVEFARWGDGVDPQALTLEGTGG